MRKVYKIISTLLVVLLVLNTIYDCGIGNLFNEKAFAKEVDKIVYRDDEEHKKTIWSSVTNRELSMIKGVQALNEISEVTSTITQYKVNDKKLELGNMKFPSEEVNILNIDHQNQEISIQALNEMSEVTSKISQFKENDKELDFIDVKFSNEEGKTPSTEQQILDISIPIKDVQDGNVLNIETQGDTLGITTSGALEITTPGALSITPKMMPMTNLNANGSDVTINTNQTLSTDQTYANLYLSGGTLDLNGHTLTVTGHLIQSNGTLNINGGKLYISGDYRLQSKTINQAGTVTYGYSSGRLVMTNAADYVFVGGNFATQSSAHHYYTKYLTAGVLEIKGNFEQKNPGLSYSEYNFIATGTHKVILSGSSTQTVSFENPGCSTFNVLEISNEAYGVSFNNGLGTNSLIGDFSKLNTITTNLKLYNLKTPLLGDIRVNGNLELYNGVLDINGHNLTVEGNLTNSNCIIKLNGGNLNLNGKLMMQGDILLNGRALTVAGDLIQSSGTLDLNGGKLTVTGHLIQSDGTININGGKLYISGDYRLQSKTINQAGTVTYGYSSGRLVMTNAADYVFVGGNFATQSSAHHYYTKYLTAGVLEIKGNFEQKNPGLSYSEYNFIATGTHKVILSGSSTQTVSFENPGCSTFNVLGISKPLETGYTFTKPPVWKTLVSENLDTQPPTKPTNLKIMSKTGTSISLSWTRSTDNNMVLKYMIYRNEELVGETSNEYFTDLGLSLSTIYMYTIKAVDVNGNVSEPSDAIQATTGSVTNSTDVQEGFGVDGEEYLHDLAAELGVTPNQNTVTYNGKTFTCNASNCVVDGIGILVNSYDFAETFESYESIKNNLVALESGTDTGILSVASKTDSLKLNSIQSVASGTIDDGGTGTSTSKVIQVATLNEKSENVKNIQIILQKLNCWVDKYGNNKKGIIKATGLLGETTKASLIKFQVDYLKKPAALVFKNGCNLSMAFSLSEYYIKYFGTPAANNAAVIAAKDYLTKLGYGEQYNLKNKNGVFDGNWSYDYNRALWKFIDDNGYRAAYEQSKLDKPTLYRWLQEKAIQRTENSDDEDLMNEVNSWADSGLLSWSDYSGIVAGIYQIGQDFFEYTSGYKYIKRTKKVVEVFIRNANGSVVLAETYYIKGANTYSGILKYNQMTSGAKASFAKLGTKALVAVGIALDVAQDYFNEAERCAAEGRPFDRQAKLSTVLSSAVWSGITTAAGTAIGAWAGSFIPVPVVGTLVGAGVGALVGYFGAKLTADAEAETKRMLEDMFRQTFS